ncbi:MAG: TetR/AcrR family transcriptional regulator [Anaeroplasma sp.]
MRRKNLSTEFIKENICLGLIDLMKTEDYHEISISDICKKAGYGRTTYYRHFSNNKDELILYISRIKWEQYKEGHIEEVKKDEGLYLLKHIYNNKSFFILLSNHKLNSLIFEIFYSIFGRQKDENPILSYGKVFFAGAYFGVVYEWILQGCNDTPEEIQKKFADGFSFAINEIKNNSKIE